MPNFSKSSGDKLNTCNQALQLVFNEIIKYFDCTILEGHRSVKKQEELYMSGKSKLRKGKHNANPSNAVDVAPYPIDWNDVGRFYYFAGQVVATARAMGITVRWGGNWSMDTKTKDNKFNDLVHFEVMEV
jgi:hypothetical protein